MKKKFWDVAKEGDKKFAIDLFGYVGGSKDYADGFNESEFISEFRKIPSDAEIGLSINSQGGLVSTALSIYAILCEHKGPISIRVNGMALSAATIITSVPGAHVVMPQGSIMMIHRVASLAAGTAEDMRKEAETMEKIENNIIDLYARKSGKEPEEIRKAVDAETWFTAQEAVDFGLADEVDESNTVTNSLEGGVTMVNGLAIPQAMLAHMPDRFVAASQSASAAIHKKEDPKMDLEKLKAEHPELVEQIRQAAFAEGQQAERARINEIDKLACGIDGLGDLVEKARNDSSMTPEKFAVAALKAQQASRAAIAAARMEDAKNIPQAVLADANESGVVDQLTESDEEVKAVVAAGRKGFKDARGKKNK